MNRSELEERLVNFAVLIVGISKDLSDDLAGRHLSGQLLRSGTSSALNYGEAQGGESRRDFIHKIKIVLKELRETQICLKIIERSKLAIEGQRVKSTIKESDELISIFVKAAETAQRNLDKENQK
jgi:four helix bundle protein